MSLDEMLTVAQKAARISGDYARSQLGRAKAYLKSPDQLATPADRRCQDMIIDLIRSHWPKHGFVAEEADNGPCFKHPPADHQNTWWVIDPLDGTANFASGIPNYAVSIGIVRAGEPVVGAIYDPNNNMMFAARKNAPARCNGRTIHCLEETLHPNSLLGIPSHYPHGLPRWIAELLQKYVCRNFGSAALHYAYVAMGALSAAFSWDVRLWDIAAGAALAQAAGAVVTDLQGKPRFPLDCADYNGEPLSIFMAGLSLHHQLSQIVLKPRPDNN